MEDSVKLSRRGFVGAVAGATAAAALGPAGTIAHQETAAPLPAAAIPPDRIGIQLFTVRDQVSGLGFAEVFRRLSEVGYREVELAGYNAGPPPGRRYSNQELRRLLRSYGLRGVGSHVNYHSDNPAAYSFTTQLEPVLDDAEQIAAQRSYDYLAGLRARCGGSRP